MNELGRRRLRERRDELKIGSRELSRRIDQSEVYISNVETGRLRDVPMSVTERIATELGVAPGWLAGLDQAADANALSTATILRVLGARVQELEERRPEAAALPPVPKLAAIGNAGAGERLDGLPGAEVSEWLEREARWAGRRIAVVEIRGTCMAPRIGPGDEAWCEYGEGIEPRDGQLVVARHDGRLVVKLWSHGWLRSYNEEPIPIDGETRVLAVVLEVRQTRWERDE